MINIISIIACSIWWIGFFYLTKFEIAVGIYSPVKTAIAAVLLTIISILALAASFFGVMK